MRCARDECDNTELTTKTATLLARSRVHVVLRVDSLDLGFHVVIGVGRLNVQQDDFIRQLHFTTQTQHQVQSSFLMDVVVRLCPVIVHPICIPNSCIFLIAKNGSFEVLSLQDTKNNTTDLYTKHLDGLRTRAFAKKLGLRFLDMAGGGTNGNDR